MFWGNGHPSQCVLNSLKDSGQAGLVQAVLVGREKSHQGLAAIFKASIPGSGLGQVEGTKVAQGTRLRALQPGTKRPLSSFLPQQVPLCQLPARGEGMGKKPSRGPSGLCCPPGSSSRSLFCLRPRCNTHRYCFPSEPPPVQTCAVAGSCGQWGWPPGQP